ncbi:transglutaminase-like domain-containing protein [Homoserinibacter sp. YIM 151385]|uniref:transglutaminase-like domain-containing protein n=1 Tax=Homoserinibacter sp. YIM 151385 TaxID=2985506 RepID=UPI0022F008DB|nr:transglutaminase domain-containing protein [Homoserinibacter sp. YIM 151385]WBU39228.1 transglutaminase domain-containing protein [Homoserinibacter sp. YIM 151385]
MSTATAPAAEQTAAGTPGAPGAPGTRSGGSEEARAVFRSARAWVDIAVVLVLAVLGMIGLGTAFEEATYFIVGMGGLLVGAAVAILSARLGFGVPLTAAVAILAYYLLGTPIALPAEGIAFVLPSVDSLSDLTVGPVFGWADILTLRPPVELPAYVYAVPYVSGWLVAVMSITLVVRWRPSRRTAAIRAALVLVWPIALYITGVLLGTDEPVFAAARGIGFGVIALVWLGWNRREHARIALAAPTTVVRRKILGTVAVVAAAAVIGAGGGILLTPPAENRFVLREEIQPPFDPLDYPSPLAGFRKYTRDPDTPVMQVDGLQPGERLRIAAMDTYDGVLWGVAGSEQALEGSGSFQLIGSRFPRPDAVGEETQAELRIEILEGYQDVWVPEVGTTSALDFVAGDPSREDLRYNAATGTTVLTTGLEPGDAYTLRGGVAVEPEDSELQEVPTAAFAPASVINNPDPVVALAGDLTAGEETPIAKLRAMQQYLTANGYYSRGQGAGQSPSRAGHAADRMNEMLQTSAMVGDEEQYASLFALMSRSLNYPTRVVLGFAPEIEEGETGPVQVTGDDVSAWVEVAFEGVGWVPFFPTPDRIDPPTDTVPKPKTEPQPQVRQPPRTDTEQDDLVSAVDIDEGDEEDDDLFGIPGWVWIVAGAILIPLAIVFVPLLVIGAIKARRMRRRREAATGDAAAAGAWDELADRYNELGYELPERSTRGMVAAYLRPQLPDGQDVAPVATRADAAVFSGREIPPEEVEALWTDAMTRLDETESALPGGRRIVSRYRLSSVRSWGSRLAQRADRELRRRGTPAGAAAAPAPARPDPLVAAAAPAGVGDAEEATIIRPGEGSR